MARNDYPKLNDIRDAIMRDMIAWGIANGVTFDDSHGLEHRSSVAKPPDRSDSVIPPDGSRR